MPWRWTGVCWRTESDQLVEKKRFTIDLTLQSPPPFFSDAAEQEFAHKPPLPLDIASYLPRLPPEIALQLPHGQLLGEPTAPIKLVFSSWSSMAHLRTGQLGALAQDYVEGHLHLEGPIQDVVRVVMPLLRINPTDDKSRANSSKRRSLLQSIRSLTTHTRAHDAAHIQFHYDVSDAFYALWLDRLRVYSCAYYRDPSMGLTQAQEAKLDHICRKLML